MRSPSYWTNWTKASTRLKNKNSKKIFLELKKIYNFVETKQHNTMVKVYFELENGKYAELVAILDTEETYDAIFPQLEKFAKKNNFDLVTESIDEETELKDLVR